MATDIRNAMPSLAHHHVFKHHHDSEDHIYFALNVRLHADAYLLEVEWY